MKTTIFLTALAIGVMTVGCTNIREKNAAELMKNSKLRDEIYSTILNTHDYYAAFMDKMMLNEECKKMMCKNTDAVKMMCMSETMDSLINNDSEIMEHVSSDMLQIMGDSAACGMVSEKTIKGGHDEKYFNDHNNEKTTMKKATPLGVKF